MVSFQKVIPSNADGTPVSNSGGSGDASAANQVSELALLATIDADTSDVALTVKTVDSVVGGTDKGIPALAKRVDTQGALTPANGDYVGLQTDANGALWVRPVSGTAQLVDDAAFAPGTTSVVVVGFEADESATDSVDEGDAGAARMTLDRKQIVTLQPHTAGGLSISRDLDLDNGTLTVVKASAGQIYGWSVTNTGTVTVFVKFYNATSGTLGTGTPVMTIGIPGNATDDTLAMQSFGGMGIEFSTGHLCWGRNGRSG